MANRRKLKKDINYLCFEVIDECFSFLEHTPSLNQENVHSIISDAVELRNILISRVNNPQINGDIPGSTSRYFNQIREELFDRTLYFVDRLNNLPR